MSICTPIVDELSRRRFAYASEDDLQAGIAQALAEVGYVVEREVRLNAHDRIDLLVDQVGIEVKIAGRPGGVLTQLRRYAQSPRIDGLVLVTSSVRHRMPSLVVGKPLECVSIARNRL